MLVAKKWRCEICRLVLEQACYVLKRQGRADALHRAQGKNNAQRNYSLQPRYQPPIIDAESSDHLEADLAASPDFVRALQDDAFAALAFGRLTGPAWYKIGDRNAQHASSGDSVAAMIAGLRARGETHFDIMYFRYYLSPWQRWALDRNAGRQISRFDRMLSDIGWRTPSDAQLQAETKAEAQGRLAQRVVVLRRVREMETRPAAWCVPLIIDSDKRLILPVVVRDRDDPLWQREWSDEQREAASADLAVRFYALADSGRMSKAEFMELQPGLHAGLKLLQLLR
ncbi:hypothetical protein J2Y55_002659 [Bosea sp. BE125]|uniref:hypothetical protein n=1 Tax=Bosea sp. BE125 TaxID=2817909 RepID=UPI00285FB48C|nr:hypothetical protein [Bosea sp. BE125]MDR6871646.1 hypothetical protein [Bosea sp. BE125]